MSLEELLLDKLVSIARENAEQAARIQIYEQSERYRFREGQDDRLAEGLEMAKVLDKIGSLFKKTPALSLGEEVRTLVELAVAATPKTHGFLERQENLNAR